MTFSILVAQVVAFGFGMPGNKCAVCCDSQDHWFLWSKWCVFSRKQLSKHQATKVQHSAGRPLHSCGWPKPPEGPAHPTETGPPAEKSSPLLLAETVNRQPRALSTADGWLISLFQYHPQWISPNCKIKLTPNYKQFLHGKTQSSFVRFHCQNISFLAAGTAPFQRTEASLSSFKIKKKIRSPIYFWTSKNGIDGTNALVDTANKSNPCIVLELLSLKKKNPLHQWLETQRCNTKTCVILQIFIVFLRLPVQTQCCIPDSNPNSDLLCCPTCGNSGLGFSPTLHPRKSKSGVKQDKSIAVEGARVGTCEFINCHLKNEDKNDLD